MKTSRLHILHQVHEGITPEGEKPVQTISTAPMSVRGIARAIRVAAETRNSALLSYGNVGCGRVWIEIRDPDRTMIDLSAQNLIAAFSPVQNAHLLLQIGTTAREFQEYCR